MIKYWAAAPLISLLAIGTAGCNQEVAKEPTADAKMNLAQEKALSDAANAIGMPNIRNFSEKKLAKQILELRDADAPTVTYLVTADAKLVKFCDSIGFGLPYSTQFTSPAKGALHGDTIVAMPQADPNGLFTIPASSADGSWTVCVNPATKERTPVYLEPKVVISPASLNLTVGASG